MKMKEKINTPTVKVLVFLITGILSLLLQEGLARNDLNKLMEWLLAYPHLALWNLLIIYSIMSIIISLVGKAIPGLMMSFSLLLLASVINHTKIINLHQPFFAGDVLYYDQIYVLLPMISDKYISSSVLSPISAALFILFCIMIKLEKFIRFRYRLLLFAVPALSLFTLVYHREIPRDIPALLETENAVWDQRLNYEKNGFLLALAFNIQPMLVDEPEEYGEEAVLELLGTVPAPENRPHGGRIQEPINLVLFVNESFSDLLHVKYEADENPLKNFQELLSRFPTFRMVSPTFGGNTSNVEFEMLTGMGNAFLPAGAVPFNHYIREEIPSIPQILKGKGYETTAIHPYYDWFWNRKQVYPKLGFDKFISMKDFDERRKRGWFISDEALVDKIIETIDAAHGPFFIHAVSMQNHWVYDPHRYSYDEMEVRGPFPENLRLAFQTYVTGLRDADRQLARLLEYLQGRPEPTIVLFSGDHLPTFGKDFALYRESGAIPSAPGDHTLEDIFNLSDLPCLLWANKENLLDIRSLPEHISPIYFPPIVLQQMGVEMPGYYQYLLGGIQYYPAIHPRFLLKSDGRLVDFLSERDNPFLRGLEMLQYDMLVGERYSIQPVLRADLEDNPRMGEQEAKDHN